MTQRHFTQNDATMLVTTNTYKRKRIFLDPALAHEAIEQIYRVQHIELFFIYGFVIMPDHCHFLMRVPAPGTISSVMRRYKMGLSFQTGISPLWQPRFHLRIPQDRIKALEYIHCNPIKAGLSITSDEYPWSSASGKWDVSHLDFY